MRNIFTLLSLGARLVVASPILDRRQGLTIPIAASAPDDASDAVDHGYPAFAMSAHSFQDYAGDLESPNTFSANLLRQVSSRTGSPVYIRVGGTSGDFSVYNANQDQALVLPDGAAPGTIPRGMSIGPSWFEGFQSFDNVKFTYMAHFANYSNKANAVAATQQALRHIGSNLESLEIGNEYTLYPGNNRPAGFSPSTLGNQWVDYADAIENAAGSKQKWQAPILAGNDCPWCLSNVFNQGFTQGYQMESASVHHYMNGGTGPSSLQSNYMNHTNVASKLNVFSDPINWMKQNRPNIPFIFGENNSNDDTAITTGNNVTLGVFGSALWLADYMLYGMTMNARRMHIQQSTGFTYTSWRAVKYYGLPPAVMPPYYAHPFVADIIGNSGDIRIKDLGVGQDNFAAYGVWDASSGALKRIVLLNLDTWRTTDDSPRPSRSVTITTNPSVSGTFQVDKLTAPGADTIDAGEVSWKGLSWTYSSNGKAVQGPSTSTDVQASNGQIGPIRIKSSEAVVVNIL